MKNFIVFMGLFTGLLTLFGCNNFADKKIAITDSTGKVEKINVNNILMTIPTIENTFPEFEQKIDSNNLSILEDDWRQIEFISKTQKPFIDREIDSINYIFEHELHQGKDYTAFKRLHVRELIKNPVSISFDKILTYLTDSKKDIAGITINGNPGQVKNGFSLSASGINYYGLKTDNNNVTTFCFYGADNDEDLMKSIEKMTKFLTSENLYLVDWIHRKVVDEKNIKDFFAPKHPK